MFIACLGTTSCLYLKNWDCDSGPYASVSSLNLNRKVGSARWTFPHRETLCIFDILKRDTLAAGMTAFDATSERLPEEMALNRAANACNSLL